MLLNKTSHAERKEKSIIHFKSSAIKHFLSIISQFYISSGIFANKFFNHLAS